MPATTNTAQIVTTAWTHPTGGGQRRDNTAPVRVYRIEKPRGRIYTGGNVPGSRRRAAARAAAEG